MSEQKAICCGKIELIPGVICDGYVLDDGSSVLSERGTADLDVAIKEACGFIPDVQETTQKNYVDAINLLKKFGFTCSIPNEIATIQDIARFLKSPNNTVRSFLAKHKEIKAIKLQSRQIRIINKKIRQMNGYYLKDVPKIVGWILRLAWSLKKNCLARSEHLPIYAQKAK
jgi:hypothetical protein